MKLSIQELMERSGVKFGTSGARGLAAAMTDFVCYAYTWGFLQYLQSSGELAARCAEVAVAGDLRPSTDRIMEAICRAVEDLGHVAVNCGKVPSPAVALFGLTRRIPAIMVTGSHIPEDRNGIKFNKCSGEILKEDEAGIARRMVEVKEVLFDAAGNFAAANAVSGPAAHSLDRVTAGSLERQIRGSIPAPPGQPSSQPPTDLRTVRSEARAAYLARYLDAFPRDALRGMRLGLYQHSAVGRDLLVEIFEGLGAHVTALGRASQFIPVDTEAIRPEDALLARDWARQHRFDAIVSTDGDSDRPLISDERGEWLRGDVAGILCARFLEADSVSTPVSCNSAVEKCGWFREVRRTRIGSPFVVAAMIEATAHGARRVVGYEANGGFLTNSDIPVGGRALRALPTRDAVILLLSVLLLAKRTGKSVSELVAALPARFTASDRLKNFPLERSRTILARFSSGDDAADRLALETVFGSLCGRVRQIDRTDGVRVTFENDEVIHLRPSGNAPEFRCYNEAATPQRAAELNARCLETLRQMQ